MLSSGSLLGLATVVSTASAAFQGFNYGSTFTTGAAKEQSDFESEFKTAAGLDGTNGDFKSARLYTMIQGGTSNDPISAIPAAISTKTSLLLGLWASGGDQGFGNEVDALQKTIDQYCGKMDDLVAGISVGSEDLYRNSPTGIKSDGNPGTNPDTLVDYIDRVRKTIKGTCLSDVPIGHVDTWTAYANGSNHALIDACDWLGMDAYAYFESTKPNAISKGKELFKSALDKVKAAGGDKEVWITETGWPVSGKKSGQAVASTKNARTFWKEVGCPRFGSTNIWWYTLQDAAPDTPNPSFGVVGSELTTKPLYDLSCDGSDTDPSPSASSSASSKSSQPEPTNSGTQSSTLPTTSKVGGSLPTQSNTQIPVPTGGNGTAVPVPTGGNGTVTTSAVPTGSGGSGESQVPTNTGGSGGSPSNVPGSDSSKLNSLGAAFVAMVLAVGLL